MKTIVLEMERLRNLNSGLGQYCLQLGRALAIQPAAAQELHFECYLPGHLSGILGASFGYSATKKWDKLMGVATGANLWHCMHQDSAYFPKSRQSAVAMTIHDLNFLERSDYSTWRKKLKTRSLQQKINRCQGLVYISEFVKNAVHENLKVPARMAEQVIYNGVAAEQVSNPGATIKEQPYLFSIGLHPKKNYSVALTILKSHPAYQWIIAGADTKGYQAELEKEAANHGLSGRLKFAGVVTEAEKWSLYAHCAALIFPSLAEGFGLPVLEAMAFGKPVFLSDRTSLPEVGGEEAFYFKSFDPEHMQKVFSEGIEQYKNDPGKAQRLMNHAAKFSWNNAAKDYLNFYQKILKSTF